MAEMEEIGYHNILEIDVSDEEIEVEDLERRMWKDRIKLQRLKEKQKLAAQEAAEKQKPMPSQAQDNYSYIHANNIVSLENMNVSGRPLNYPYLQNPPDMPHEAAYNLDLRVAEYGPRQEGQQHQHLQASPAVNIDPIRQPENAAITMPVANMKGDEITGGDINYFAKDAFQNELDKFGSPLSNMSFDFGVFDNPPSPPFLLDDFMGPMSDDEMIKYFGG